MAGPTDKVFLNGLTFYGYHGTKPEERSLGQRFQVDIEVFGDLHPAAQTGDLADAIHYVRVYRTVREVMEGEPQNMLETLAEGIAGRVLANEPAQAVRIRITKLSPALAESARGTAGVEIYRERE